MVSQTDVIHESGKCTERHSSLMSMVSLRCMLLVTHISAQLV